MFMNSYDIAIIGGGPGGYVAAIRAAQLGLSVALIEREKVGGTCLHKGCIPSKAFLRSAELFHRIKHADMFGIEVAFPGLNWKNVLGRKNMLVQVLYQGVLGLIKKKRIDLLVGTGQLLAENFNSTDSYKIAVNSVSEIRAKHVILATGSRPVTGGLHIDNKQVMTSDQAVDRETLPSSVLIIGGGTIGIEWASIYRDCGSKVTVIESTPCILLHEDREISKEMEQILSKGGVRILKGSKADLQAMSKQTNSVSLPVVLEDGSREILEAEALLLAIGRSPNSDNICENSKLLEKDHGFIRVNPWQETSIRGIYAVGDVCGGGLAHVAARQGTIAVENIAGLSPRPYNARFVAKCTYGRPEIASIGYTEEEALKAGKRVKIGKFPFRANGKALVDGDYEGFSKIITDEVTGTILGVHLIGPHATELIAEAGVTLTHQIPISEWMGSVHSHPTLSEAIFESLLAVEQRTIHV